MRQYILIGSICLLIMLSGCTMNTEQNEQVVIKTNKGNIVVELDREHAPVTVENFLSYIEEGFYQETLFHRVIDGFMIQGGGFTLDKKFKDTKEPIILESGNGLNNTRGTIAMARTNDPNSATSQFFINLVDNDFLDKSAQSEGYAVFGKVVEGMDVVDNIATVKTGSVPMKDWPIEDVIIEDITIR